MAEIKTYPEQLQEMATVSNIELKDAFVRAAVPDSTYYRSIKGARHLQLDTAEKIARAITQLAAEQQQS